MSDPAKRLAGLPFVIGGLSFIPLLGVLFGLVAVIWGLTTRKLGGKKLALVGALGIVFTVVIYGSLFYFGFVQRGGVYDELRAKLAKTTLNSVVQAVEFYKLQHGNYPASLDELRSSLPKDSAIFIYDPTIVGRGDAPREFYYERVDAEHYFLRGVGPDGQPFTADDIVPDVEVQAAGKIGLLTERPTAKPNP